MVAGLEAGVKGGPKSSGASLSQSKDFGVGRTRAGVMAFSYDLAIFYQYCANQGVRVGVAAAPFCELEGALDKALV
jgi:hypothetical protein